MSKALLTADKLIGKTPTNGRTSMHTKDKVAEKIIFVIEEKIITELTGLVRETVEQKLNKLLGHEAENLLKAKPYEDQKLVMVIDQEAILEISKQSQAKLN